MNSRIKMAGALMMVGALAACANQPVQHMSGSAPVNGGYSSSGYSQPINNGGYNNGNYNNANNSANYGVVERIDTVEAKKDSLLGAAIGAGVGAVVGNQIGRQMNDAKTTGTVAGAVGGGLLGNAIEKHQRQTVVYDVNVRMEDGTLRTVRESTSPAVGEKVRVEADGLHART